MQTRFTRAFLSSQLGGGTQVQSPVCVLRDTHRRVHRRASSCGSSRITKSEPSLILVQGGENQHGGSAEAIRR